MDASSSSASFRDILVFLSSFAAVSHYSGFWPLARCLEILSADPTLSGNLQRNVLLPVSREYGVSVQTLYRRLGTVVRAMFRDAPMERWESLGLYGAAEPSVGIFLSAASLYLYLCANKKARGRDDRGLM